MDEIVITPNGMFSLMDETFIFGTIVTLNGEVMDVVVGIN
jgi:hypothetical protein